MIDLIEINGFKSFVSQSININSLTILTGLNSSGKSSVIQALRIIDRVAKHEKDPLLEGHGTVEELKNPYSDDGIFIKVHCAYNGLKGSLTYHSERGAVSTLGCFPEIIYISADRFGPQTSIPIVANHKIGSKGENVLNCIRHYYYEAVNEIMKHDKSEGDTFNFNLEAWLGSISPGIKFNYAIQEMADSSYSLFNDHRAMNVGFGLSYTLPIIVALFVGTIEPNTIVLIENPEAHLHPKGQSELAKLIALSVEAGAQVVVETHSDHLFDGLRVYAKKNKGFAKKINTYWFELDSNKNSIVESAILDDSGRLNKWPKGMFDQFEINASELL